MLACLPFQNSWSHSTLHTSEVIENVKVAPPGIIVVFGATGDLTARKLMPSIYHLASSGYLSDHTAMVGVSRIKQSHEEFRDAMKLSVNQYSKQNSDIIWPQLEKKLFYNEADLSDDEGYENLKVLLADIDKNMGTQGNRVFYLAIPASYFSVVIEKLSKHGLIYDSGDEKWSRVVIEKPFGRDLASAIELNREVSQCLSEDQIFLMDHYLAKEGVQNLFSFRLENPLFEPLWNHRYIDNIQISLSEDIGIGSRANFWEETGALRDLFQNHLMQLLAIVAMEPPTDLDPQHIHNEKIKVLNSIRPFPVGEIDRYIVRGQYGPGIIKGENVLGYKQEKDVPQDSSAETFVSAKIFIDNDRWMGVPFYIRGGKRLAKQTTEVVVNFKQSNLGSSTNANALFFRIQPNAGIYLKMSAKVPVLDSVGHTQPVVFGYQPDQYFKTNSSDAYEKLLYDAFKGNHHLFVQSDEQLAAWRLLTPVLDQWKLSSGDLEEYESGSWGPSRSDFLLNENGHSWQILGDQ